MAVQANIVQNFTEFAGLDYRSNNITRDQRFALSASNAITNAYGDIVSRPGVQPMAFPRLVPNSASRSWGPWKFRSWNDIHGEFEEQLLVQTGNGLLKLNEEHITITRGVLGAGDYFIVCPVETAGVFEYHAMLYRSPTVIPLDVPLGSLRGTSLATFYNIATLVAAINGTPNYTCTYSGGAESARIAACHLPVGAFYLPTSTSINIAVWYFDEIEYSEIAPTSEQLALGPGEETNQNVQLHEYRPCVIDIQTALLLPSSSGGVFKYDGVALYHAGLPTPDAGAPYLQAAAVAGGALGDGISDSDYYWSYTYEMADAQNSIIEGNASADVHLSIGGAVNRQADITIPAISACNAGGTNTWFMRNHAYANNGGTETGTTLHVDNGAGGDHTLRDGQKAFFRDNAGVLHTRNITARTATTIDIDGAAVTIANNAFISAGLKINLYRNKAGGALKFLVRTFAEAPIGIVYRDNTADAALGFEYVPPFEDLGHGPPKCTHVDTSTVEYDDPVFAVKYKNLVVLLSERGRLQFSDPDGPEYFATGGSSIQLSDSSGERFTGLGSNGDALFAFKPNAIFIIRGDLTTGKWSQERLAGCGCDANATIAEINGNVWFWSAKYGVNRIGAAGRPISCSYRIDTLTQTKTLFSPTFYSPFTDSDYSGLNGFAASLAIAHYTPEEKLYYLFIPYGQYAWDIVAPAGPRWYDQPRWGLLLVGDVSVSDEMDNLGDDQTRTASSVSRVRWWLFSNVNFQGGAVRFKGQEYFLMFDDDLAGGAVGIRGHLVRHMVGHKWGYSDFAQPINFIYEHGWIHLGTPSEIKKWIAAEIYSFRSKLTTAEAASFTLTVTIDSRYIDGTGMSSQSQTFVVGGSADPAELRFEFRPFIGKAIKIKFSGTFLNTSPMISGWSIEVEPSYNPHIGRDNG